MSTTQRHTVIPRTLCFIYCGTKLLLLRYGDKKGEMSGWYNCPGGHIEQGEDIVINANREIREETGLHVESSLRGIVHVDNFFGKHIMIYVTVATIDKEIQYNGPEGRVEWFERSELDQLNIFSDIIVIDQALQEKRGVFTATSRFDGKGEMLSFTLRE